MPGRHFYLPPEDCRGPMIHLTGREAHHALHVLRVRVGDQVIILDGAGTERFCEVKERSRDTVSLAVREKRSVAPLPYRITLAQALPKGKLIESIIQKGTELGVHRIVPLLSERVVAQLEDEDAAQRAAKWQWVAIEAAKQCGSAWLPRVDPPLTPRQLLDQPERFDLDLIGSLQAGSRHPRFYVQDFDKAHGRKPETIRVWIGPEGDFTPEEIASAEAAGALPITLGRLVLRTDTAAIYCLSVLNYEMQFA